MLTLLQSIALGIIEASPTQVKAAAATLPYTHSKKGEGGKKDAKQEAAEQVANKFAPSPPPLKLVKR